MGDLTGAEIVAALVDKGTRRDLAVMYADAFLEYRAAQANIAAHGAIVKHPRTGNPIANPYLVVRDRALATLWKFRTVRADFLW